MGKKYIKSNKSSITTNENPKIYLYFLLASALLLRFIIAAFNQGYVTDINSFKAWAEYAASKGIQHVYNTGMDIGYPPGYIFILYLIGLAKNIFGVAAGSNMYLLLIKLPAIIADILTSFVIFRIAKKYTSYYVAIGLSMLYAFNPTTIVDSCVWGQVDSVLTLFILLTIYYLVEDKMHLAAIFFAIAVLMKPQALIFTPVILFAVIAKKDIKKILLSVLYGIITLIIVVIPFSINQKPDWLIKYYTTTINSFPYTNLNAFNFYGFIGANAKPVNDKLLFFSYNTWGYISIVLSVVFCGYFFFKAKDKSKYFYMGAFLISSTFMFSVEMHERYLFPVLALLLMTYIYTKNRRILYVFIGFSITQFINIGLLYDMASTGTYYFASDGATIIFLSLINLILFGFMVKTGIDVYIKEGFNGLNTASIKSNTNNNNNKKHNSSDKNLYLDGLKSVEEEKEVKTPFTKKDFVLITGLTILYAVIALYNLGSVNVPKTFWKPLAQNESVCLDLGKSKNIDRIYYYSGLNEGADSGKYKIYTSNNNKDWVFNAEIIQSSIWTWNYTNLSTAARYLRIEAENTNGTLYEVGLFDSNTKQIKFKVKKYDSNDNAVLKAFDEQRSVAYTPSYMNGMYFDEIYHARTAYENIHFIQPYEWTHPPLGKLLIAVGVLIFGMDPFGWRIVGTLLGIIMIPCIYLLAKEIFKKTEYAFIAAFLLTFDFMHFSQTRIATVDVYGVFFIILMYYFMCKYINLNIEEAGKRKGYIILGACGISFGLGIASKWIGIYAGAGLAIIFFKALYDKYVKYKILDNARKSNKPKTYKNTVEEKYSMYNEFPIFFRKTILFSVIFFIIIPFCIYIASYIPFMMIKGPGHGLSDVFQLQQTMYDYHKNLVATHPFSSKWWEWPLMIKPVWYYSGQTYLADGKISSIVAMGNPAIWWLGSILTIVLLVMSYKLKDKKLNFILIGFLSQYLPWIPITRLTFIYHFFASVPFIILLIVYTMKKLEERYQEIRYLKYIKYGYLALVLILFIMFYPILSGMIVDKSYVSTFLRWSDGWYFFS